MDVHIYLPDTTHDELVDKLEGRPKSAVIRKLVEGYIRGDFEIDWRK